MKEIKVRFLQDWIELPYDLPLIDLVCALANIRFRLVWNIQARRLEIKDIY